jgi:hypothetical protein
MISVLFQVPTPVVLADSRHLTLQQELHQCPLSPGVGRLLKASPTWTLQWLLGTQSCVAWQQMGLNAECWLAAVSVAVLGDLRSTTTTEPLFGEQCHHSQQLGFHTLQPSSCSVRIDLQRFPQAEPRQSCEHFQPGGFQS